MVARLSKTEVARLVARSVETPDEVLLFQASSDEDAAAWVDCINGVLAARGDESVVNEYIIGLKDDAARGTPVRTPPAPARLADHLFVFPFKVASFVSAVFPAFLVAANLEIRFVVAARVCACVMPDRPPPKRYRNSFIFRALAVWLPCLPCRPSSVRLFCLLMTLWMVWLFALALTG